MNPRLYALQCAAFADAERRRVAAHVEAKARQARELRSERAKRGWEKRKGLIDGDLPGASEQDRPGP